MAYYRVFQKKIVQSLRHHNFATAHHRVIPFSAKCSERKCLHDKASVWIRQSNILCYSAGKWTM